MFLILEVSGPLAAALGSAARQVFDTEGGTIGRDPGCTWVLPDPYVSAQHAVITFHDGTFLIEDTSVNGVFINTPDSRIPRHVPTPIRSGDTIFVELYEIRAEIVSNLSMRRDGHRYC
jgi:type VI secretion system FHA domain protein